MDPGAAADLLAELPEEQSDAILEEMEPEERQEVEELLEFDEDSAAGCMTTDFVYLGMQMPPWPRPCRRCAASTATRRA
jgi:magnesium transporter